MRRQCPTKRASCLNPGRIVRFGRYYRTSDRKWVQRYKCAHCGRHFSQATNSPNFGQNKRHLNNTILWLLASRVSQRRIAKGLNVHQLTVRRKLKFLGEQARLFNHRDRIKRPLTFELQFDDLETIEHTKLKPVSVTVAVEKGSRYILGFEVSRMPAKGLLAKKALKKYGYRVDERAAGRNRLFRKIRGKIAPNAIIQSDENPHYKPDVKEFFPDCQHLTVKGQRGAVQGQGELKKVGFDPLFTLNHTLAMMRDNINRLIRKTWCTTKKIQPLTDHLELYVYFHNQLLIPKNQT